MALWTLDLPNDALAGDLVANTLMRWTAYLNIHHSTSQCFVDPPIKSCPKKWQDGISKLSILSVRSKISIVYKI